MDVTGWHTLPLSSDESCATFGLKEAAAYLGMKPEPLRNACHARRATYFRLNYRTWRFTKPDLDNFTSYSGEDAFRELIPRNSPEKRR